MPPPSRRSSSRNSGSSARAGTAPVAPTEKSATEEIDVEIPAQAEDSSALNTAVSGRRSSARNSRRSAASSGRSGGSERTASSNRVSARRPATPEELAKRRQNLRTMLKIVAGVALTVIVVAVLVLVVFKKDPIAEGATTKLAAVQAALSTIDTRVSYDEAVKQLASVPDLPAIMPRKAELKKALDELDAKVSRGEREARVVENRKNLLNQLAKLTDPAVDLDKLSLDCLAFVKNPVDPTAAPNPSYASEFSSATNDIQVRVASIETERGRRETAATTGVSQRVQLECEGLIKDEKFGAALALIEENAAKYPKADLARARTYVKDSAASAWTSVQGYVDNRYKDFASPGINPTARTKALEEAHARLDGVATTWGIDTYVTQARELRAKY